MGKPPLLVGYHWNVKENSADAGTAGAMLPRLVAGLLRYGISLGHTRKNVQGKSEFLDRIAIVRPFWPFCQAAYNGCASVDGHLP